MSEASVLIDSMMVSCGLRGDAGVDSVMTVDLNPAPCARIQKSGLDC